MTVRIVVFRVRRVDVDLNFVGRAVRLFLRPADQSFVRSIFFDGLGQFLDVTAVLAARDLHDEIGLKKNRKK